MPSLASSFVILGEPKLDLSIGADFSPAIENLTRDYDVIAAPLKDTLNESFRTIFDQMRQKSPWIQLVLISPAEDNLNGLREAYHYYSAARIADSILDVHFEAYLAESLEKAQQIKQNFELERLVQEQNERLKLLYNELEDRVQKRQHFLEEAKRKTLLAGTRWETLRQATMIIHQSSTVGDMESTLQQLLRDSLDVDVVRILFHPQDVHFSEIQARSKLISFSSSLNQPREIEDEKESFGRVFFLRESKKAFNREEGEFLNKLAEVIALALDRLKKLQESKTFKEQWEATFDAVSEPVMMVNDQLEIIQTNASFYQVTQKTLAQTAEQKCFQILFDREHPCPGCRLGTKFRTEGRRALGKTFEVMSQQVKLEPFPGNLYFNQYSDITDQVRMERKLLDTAKLAELGTIGSSIAHELNNPLGGMLSFVQLIKMDLPKSDPLYEDICALEVGAKRCRDIVQNLLGFSRNPGSEESQKFDLRDALDRALRIAELQTKSHGIEIKLHMPSSPVPVHGHLNMMAQAIQHILQSIIFSFQNQTDSTHHPLIEIKIGQEKSEPILTILDNGPGPEIGAGLGFSVASQIIREHNGSLDTLTSPKQLRIVKITFPRPD